MSSARHSGRFVRETATVTNPAARQRISDAGLDEWATDNLLHYLTEQREATGSLPDDRTIVLERFRDEIGDWRVVVHSPYGRSVHAPWALAVAARMRERFGVDVNAMAADDGIVLRLPDVEFDAFGGVSGGASGERDGDAARDGIAGLVEAILIDPDEVAGIVTEEIGGSPLFASRFRECAARALLLPRRRPDRRQPLWQQRQRAAHLLEVASAYPTFPIILETVRECVQDVFDVPALVDLLRRMQRREVQVVDVQTPQPSPFAQSMLFGYIAAFLYEGDSPLAERRAAALALDPALLADLLGQSEGLSLRDLLSESITRPRPGCNAAPAALRDSEDVVDLPAASVRSPRRRSSSGPQEARPSVPAWLDRLVNRQVIAVRIGGGIVLPPSRRRPTPMHL